MLLEIEFLSNSLAFDLLVCVPIFLFGAGLYLVREIRFKIPPGHIAVIPDKSKIYTEGWNWGLLPKSTDLIPIASKTFKIPTEKDKWIEVETPDEGVLGIEVSLSYMPNANNLRSITNFRNTSDIEKVLDIRVRSALRDWVWQRPKPGTLKRALASKLDAEQAILSKITFLHTDTLARLGDTASYNRYPINDLGIVIREIHITDMCDLQKGTGKPSWGDDDEIIFDAEKARMRVRQLVNNVSDLRKEHEALLKEFPAEKEHIETLIEEERIRSTEHRDR